MPRTASLTPTGRVTARIPQQIQDTLEYAASLAGATLNQFLIQAALKEAETVIKNSNDVRRVILSAKEYQRLWNLIENPPPPTDKLKQAFAKRQELLHVPD
ncbi:MAG: DUF1778 domain-containing protein [Holosporales bacterium]